ncbi:MAG: efflux RND transporter permease subunit [Proteobacteria bacterium]|nr:efflux RND transporter permease subunit [Pseudomonadota bacterium]
MKRAVRWFAENHVAANLIMALLVIGGLTILPTITQEVFPDLALDVVTVSVEYPGASPQEVEEAVSLRIEEELQGLQGVKRIRSVASENIATVNVELMAGEDVRRRLDDVRARVDAITTFPDQAERPQVKQMEIRRQVLNVAVSGPADERTLKRLGERVRDEIATIPIITDVQLYAARPYEISIEVSERALRRFGLEFDDVVRAVQRSSLDLPGGSIKTEAGEILLRAKGRAYSGRDFADLALVTGSDGTRLRLGDVARVIDGFEETDQASLFDGEPAVLVQVFRVGDQNALEISEAVRSYVASASVPEGISLTVWQDDARFLRARLGSLLGNARDGFILVVLVLALFLRLRLAMWVSLGIPLSFLGALALLPTFDVSINLISLTAFIVVLGIVVDDAIVVGENIHTEQQRGLRSRTEGAVKGAQGILVPVTFGVLTTMAAFSPMLFVPGPMGRLARLIPMVVILCLAFSLIESLLVLPAHLGHGTEDPEQEPKTRIVGWWRRGQKRIADGLHHFLDAVYRPALQHALVWRYLTVSLAIAAFLLSVGMLAGGWLRFVFQPDVEGDTIAADLTMPEGTPAHITAEAIETVTSALERVRASADADRDENEGSVFRHVMASVGEQPYRAWTQNVPGRVGGGGTTGAHLGEVQVEVIDSEERDQTVAWLTRRWREEVGEIPGAVELAFTSSLVNPGAPIDIELRGDDLDELRDAAEFLRGELAGYPAVFDVADSFRSGKQELELSILPSAETLGLSLEDLGRQVRQAFHGDEAQRIQRGRDDVRVVVRYPAAERRSLQDVESMYIRTRDGREVPFGAVAQASFGTGFASIQRLDRQRVVNVTADVDPALGNANEIVADLEESALVALGRDYPGVRHGFAGEQQEQRDFLASMLRGQALALLVIFGLLAVPLRSYVQPFIIMTAIPFGLVGAAWGHILLGHDFSMFSVIGLVALSGVVVNDSLVLVDSINRRRAEGSDIHTAVSLAGPARFRAILLTSLTTFAGLSPLMLETSVQAQFLIPMAISLAFGVIFASFITLLVVPCTYLILDDLDWAVRQWRFRGKGLPEADVADAPELESEWESTEKAETRAIRARGLRALGRPRPD